MMKWLAEIMALENGNKDVRCPCCGSASLDSGFVLIDKENKMGFCAVWCNHCHKGKIISRCKQSGKMKTIENLPTDIDYC